ncbi:NAD(P)/FAD-dependent oxidoreductase [Paraburkholderia gardini]|uniref:NAD(P)/FAD-dependent oxidoreductase n=1 Tax=Paraburkholderia gardini TaxID=2823469 RepID=UPI001E17A226|nr:FAD-dependent oxidoreductase [Paraburkholderia gardini]CAG4925070.1 Rubredoxin-NAD(+) reductase [Paraburkholderia gardini]
MNSVTQQSGQYDEGVVIIGAGLAGWSTIREIRKRDALTPITLISSDDAHFYSKPMLSNAIAQKRLPSDLITTPASQLAQTLDVKLMARSYVMAIDTNAKTLQVLSQDGREAMLSYRSVVFATGAVPARLSIDGDGGRVVSVNNLEDYRIFRSHVEEAPKRVLIIGAGLIGCEFADDLVSAGHEVRVVDPVSRPLASMLPEPASLLMRDALAKAGVQWHFGATVEKVEHLSDQTLHVTLSAGAQFIADVVLSAVGLRANTELAHTAGIHCDRGIVVDEFLQTSATGVYAIGDVAQYFNAGNTTLPYVMPILHAAKALGATIAGEKTAVRFPVMPVSIKTPSLPTSVAPPAPGVQGSWRPLGDPSHTAWRFLDMEGRQTGFALMGEHVGQRATMIKAMSN